MKKYNCILTAIFFLTVFYSCTKEPDSPAIENKIVIGSTTQGAISYTTASVSSSIISISGKSAIQHGHCWSVTASPSVASSKTALGSVSEAKSFTSQLENLLPNTTYYVRAYATTELATTYGTELTIKTIDNAKPTIETIAISEITHNSAKSGGNATADGGLPITARGLVWNTTTGATITSKIGITTDNSGLGNFTSQLTGLQPETTYYFRAYATNNSGTAYGTEYSFKTKGTPALADLTTNSPTDINGSSAVVGGNITNEGNLSVSERGICYGTNPNPTTNNNKVAIGAGIGSFSKSITGLTVNTTYYVRAYAINSQGTAYGNEISFKTVPILLLDTSDPINVTYQSAELGGNIINEGGSPVTERGICYSKNQNPTINDSKMAIGVGIGSYKSLIAGLLTNTTYYVRAYAIDNQGTSYGKELIFKTKIVSVGDYYQGGIVAYIFKSSDPGYIQDQTHGLIAAEKDRGPEKWWTGTVLDVITTGATGLTIGTGKANTSAIVTKQGASTYAAKICYDLVLNERDDWYLPSRDELNALYENRILISGFTLSHYYWSSSESDGGNAWGQMFDTALKDIRMKQSSYYFRPIRNF